jgi:hypothetical protein
MSYENQISELYFLLHKNNINDDFSDILNFRIKNTNRSIDIEYFNILLQKLYNIIIDK